MLSTEIIWRTAHGDLAGVTVHDPDAADPQVRLVIGTGFTLRLPVTEARLLARALINATTEPVASEPRKTIPIHAAPPAPLYHEPEEEPHG